MNIHDRRSLALHRAAAQRLQEQPIWLEQAKQRVTEWLAMPQPPHYAKLWMEILARPLPDIINFMLEDSERAQELRSSSPFAGILSPRERWTILKQVR